MLEGVRPAESSTERMMFNYPLTHTCLCQAYLGPGKYDEAVNQIEKVVRLVRLAVVYAGLRDEENALQRLKQAVRATGNRE